MNIGWVKNTRFVESNYLCGAAAVNFLLHCPIERHRCGQTSQPGEKCDGGIVCLQN